MATTAVLNLGINTKQFHRGLKGAGMGLKGFMGMSAGGIAMLGGAFVAGLGVAGASLIKLGSDAEETENKFNTVFDGLGKSASDMASELQNAYGMSEMQSQRMLGATGDLLTGLDFTKKTALDLSGSIQKLATDLASFQNLEGGAENASKRLTSALTGETEGLKALGIVIRQDSKEFKDQVKSIMESTGATLQQAKAQVILQQATAQSKNAIGDYARTEKQLANQLRLTGAIWEDLTVGVGKFLMEFTGAEDATLNFNDAFRNMTDNLLGYLKNWQQNWSILKNWISENIITIFTTDLPNAISIWVKNSINNIAVVFKLMGDLTTQFAGWFVGQMSNLFTGDTFTSGLQEAFRTMIRWGTEVWDNLVRIFKGDSGGKEFSSNLKKGMDVAFGSKGLGETLNKTISDNLKNIKMPLEGFESATSDLEFMKYVPKDLMDSADELNKALKPVDEVAKRPNGDKSGEQQNKIQDALVKGSLEAFKKEKQTDKTQNKIEKWTKETAENTKNAGSASITVNQQTIAG